MYSGRGSLNSFGSYGFAWAKSAEAFDTIASARVYYFTFTVLGLSTSASPTVRWNAFPIRCLVKMLDIIHLSYYQDFYEHQQG